MSSKSKYQSSTRDSLQLISNWSLKWDSAELNSQSPHSQSMDVLPSVGANKGEKTFVLPQVLVRVVHRPISPNATAFTGLHGSYLDQTTCIPNSHSCESIKIHTKATFYTHSFANISTQTSFDLPLAFVLVTHRPLCSMWVSSTISSMLHWYS